MCEQLLRRGGHWSHEECPAFCSSVSEDQEGDLPDWYFWGRYNYLGMHFHVNPDGTENSHSILWISLDIVDLLELFQSSCPLVVIILQMCQRKMCKYGSDCKTGTWHLLILKKSVCTIFRYDYHGYARTISWKQTFLLLLCEFI